MPWAKSEQQNLTVTAAHLLACNDGQLDQFLAEQAILVDWPSLAYEQAVLPASILVNRLTALMLEARPPIRVQSVVGGPQSWVLFVNHRSS